MAALLHLQLGGDRWANASVSGMVPRDHTEDGSWMVRPPLKNRRRERTHFSNRSVSILEEAFSETRYPDITQRERLAAQLDVEEARVHTWFQNKRARQKRISKSRRATPPPPAERTSRKPERPLPTDTVSPASSNDSATEAWNLQPPSSFKRPWCDDNEEILSKRLCPSYTVIESACSRVLGDVNEPLDLTTSGNRHLESAVEEHVTHQPQLSVSTPGQPARRLPTDTTSPASSTGTATEVRELTTSGSIHRESSDGIDDVRLPPQLSVSAVNCPPSPMALPYYLSPYATHIFPTSPGLTPLAYSPLAVDFNSAFTFPPHQRFTFPPISPKNTSPCSSRTWGRLDDTTGSSDADSSGYISLISPDRP